MTSRDQFEQAYAEDEGHAVEWCVDQRMINGSYRLLKMASAWRWWQRAKEAA
jgi:hypothetical protein